MKQDIWNGMKLVNINLNQMQVFVMINNVGIMINADVNANDRLEKEDVTNDLFGVLVNLNVNVINHVILDNIWIRKIVNAGKN